MPRALNYRPIETADCAAVVELHRSTFSCRDIEASIFVSSHVENYLAQLVAFPELQTENWLWGAWLNTELVGYIYGRALPEAWHLNYLAVSANCQGRGIGQELWQRWNRVGRERGYRSFTVDVADDNERARAWYERMGYCSVETTWFYREELAESRGVEPQKYHLLNWENAQAWQTQYGFSQFQLAASEESWSFGRLGAKYFRAQKSPPPPVKSLLRQLDATRQLLLLSAEPVSGMEEIKVSYRLKCDI